MVKQKFSVEHHEQESKFTLLDRGADGSESKAIGNIDYVDVSAERVMYHTFVAEEHSGQGLASMLARAAVEKSVNDNFKIVAVCPYVSAWLKKHADEFDEHQTAVTPRHLEAVKNLS